MFAPVKEYEDRLEVKHSRFIGGIYPVDSVHQAEEKIQSVRRVHSGADHHCWAYRLQTDSGISSRSSDEGEPSGTAGRPILESLEEKDIVDAILLVSRFFGGIKLGMGGLSRAYRACARQVIAGCALKEKLELKQISLTFNYASESGMRRLLATMNGVLIQTDYTDKVLWRISLPSEAIDQFLAKSIDICSGEIKYI